MASKTPDLQIGIAKFVRKMPLAVQRVHRLVHTVWEGEKGRSAQLSIAFVGEQRIGNLTEQYVGRRYRTDVLAFELSDNSDGSLVGQVVVNCELARQRSARLKTDPAGEAALYLVHGLLHLLGYDDKTVEQADEMHGKAIHYLRRSGFRITAALSDLHALNGCKEGDQQPG